MVRGIVRSGIKERFLMPAYRDKKRSGVWRYRKWIVTPSGKRIRITGTPPTDTKVAAESAERAHIDRVLNPDRYAAAEKAASDEKDEVPTVEGFATKFETEYLPRSKPTERRSKKSIINGEGGLVAFFGALRLDEINQGHVNAFVLAQGSKSTKTINNKLTVLSTMLRYAHALGLIAAPKIKCHIKSMSPEVIAVPAEDVAKLLAAAGSPLMQVAVLLATEAGLRVGEIRGLQWSDIRGGQLIVRRAIDQEGNVTTPKHDKRRSVPLSPALATALRNLSRRGLWVLSDEDSNPWTYDHARWYLNDLYAAAEVAVPVSETGVTMPWHSLRHTFGTELAARGVPIPVIKELMGHASIATTMRYVTVTGAQLNTAIETAFGQPMGNTPAAAQFTNSESKEKTPGVTGGSEQ
jgi:integrase